VSWSRNTPRATRPQRFAQLAFFPVTPRVARVYHPYSDWEEYHYGMWRDVTGTEREQMLPAAITFTGDAPRYGRAMLRVTEEWPISCEHNLTCAGMNRQAWIGHAAVALELGIPEHITREAWHHLTQPQRDAANGVAETAILTWERAYVVR